MTYCYRCGRETIWKDAVCSECRHGPYLSAQQPDGEPFVTTTPSEYDPEHLRQVYGSSGCRLTPRRGRKER